MAGSGDDDDTPEATSSPAEPTDETPDESKAEPVRVKRQRIPVWLETVVLLVVAVVLALVVKTFLAQAFYIPSASMEPGLQVGDRIVVQKVSYWFGGSPQRGDVVVFADPGDWLQGQEDAGPGNLLSRGLEKIGLYPSGGHLVKRVIGLPGDVIRCCDKKGRLMVNGQPLDESGFVDPALRRANVTCDGPMPNGCTSDWSAGPVPPGELFVMGDNRDDSEDSSARLCIDAGPACDPSDAYVPIDLVVGKVLAVVWPTDHWALEHRPSVFDDVPDSPPSKN